MSFGDALNPAMFAQCWSAQGFRVTDPQMLCETVAKTLATPAPVVVDGMVEPTEISAMPDIKLDQVWKFRIGKVREHIEQ